MLMLIDRSFETDEIEDTEPLQATEERTIYEELGELTKICRGDHAGDS